MGNLAIAASPASVGVIRMPEDRVLGMIAQCTAQLDRVASIADARVATDMAEAVAAISRKVKLCKETKDAAIRLLIQAEQRLGEVIAAAPRAYGNAGPEVPRRRDILKQHGISKSRANLATRLAKVPQKRIDAAIAGGAKTMHAVTAKVGLVTHAYELRTEKASAFALLAEEAVGLLERSVRAGVVPHRGTVAEMVSRLRNIQTHGNAK